MNVPSPKSRPAEFTAAAAAIAFLIMSLLGADDPALLTALAVVIGFIPTAVTATVEYIRGQRRDEPEPGGTTLAPSTMPKPTRKRGS